MNNEISLSELISSLKDELTKAQDLATGSAMKFQLESAELEVSVGITRTETTKAGLKFWVLEGGREFEGENITTQKITLVLKPDASGGIVVNSNSAAKASNS